MDEQLSARPPVEIQKVKKIKQKKINKLRYAEYYDHRLVHSTKKSTIDFYLGLLKLNDKQLKKLNHLRELAGLPAISQGD